MIKYWMNILVALAFVFFPTTVFAVVFVPYNITEDTVWNASSSPYIISGALLQAGKKLTIEEGTVVKFSSQGYLWIYGDLEINGTDDNKVYFTSIKDDEIGGDTNGDGDSTTPLPSDWRQLSFKYGSSANIDNVVIRYGGDTFCGFHTYCKGNLYNSYGNIYLNNSQISNSGSYGIYQEWGNTTVLNTEINDSQNGGVHVYAGGFTINNSSIHDNLYGALNNIVNGIIDATNNWWGDPSGPTNISNPGGTGDTVHGSVNYDPWLTSESGQEINPVIIIPGILGSWEKNGKWVIDPVFHTYDDLILTLELNGYEKEIDLFTFPYDWRNSNVDTALVLDEKIDEIKEICECDKVDIVSHSMGGLIARQYIQSNDYDEDVDQLIFLGTPHLGSPKSYLMWEGGEMGQKATDNVLSFIYTREAEKNGYNDLFDYVRNKPIASIQQLLPTFDYLMEYESSIMRTYPNQYPRNEFLEELNENVGDLLSSGVDITNIIGEGQSTIEKIKVLESSYLPMWEHGYPIGYYEKEGDRGIETGNGDRTIPILSASFINQDLNILSTNHVSLPKVGQSLVFEKLTNNQPDQISDEFRFFNVKLLIIKILSPVDVQVVDPEGRRVGKDFITGEEFSEIYGAFYSGFETNNEYITIFSPIDGDYSVITEGTDGGGKYTVVVGLITDEGIVENEFISHILPNSFEEVSFTLDNNLDEIEIEEETNISLSDLILHINQTYLLGWINNDKLKTKLVKIVDKVIKEEQKLSENRGTTKIQRILEKEFLKTLESGLKTRRINEEGYNLLNEDILLLINNL